MNGWLIILATNCIYLVIVNADDQLATVNADASTLVFVHALWRHGDRSPSILLPSDSDNPLSSWPDGLGEVTTVGLEQQFRLGRWFRRRYADFVSQSYSPFEISVRSSDYNRTLMSAYANLAGFFFPINGSRKWRAEGELGDVWFPIPVHTRPQMDDLELNENVNCPAVDAEYKRVEQTPEVKQIEQKNAKFMEFISVHAGFNKTTRLNGMWDIYDPLFCEMNHKESHQWPSWMNESIFEEIHRLYDLSAQFYYHTDLLKRLRGGPLLVDILSRMEDKAAGLLDKRVKMFLYSAHDTTLGVLLSILMEGGIKVFPHYATTVIIELHYINGEYHVQLFHKNVTDSDNLYRLTINGCSDKCTLADFRRKFAHLIPADWRRECGLELWYHASTSTYLGIIIILSLFVIILVTLIIVDLTTRLQRNNRTRSNVRNGGILRNESADESCQQLTTMVYEDDDEENM